MSLTYNTFRESRTHNLWRRRFLAIINFATWPSMTKFYEGNCLLAQSKSCRNCNLRHSFFDFLKNNLVSFFIRPGDVCALVDNGQCLVSLFCFNNKVRAYKAQQSLGIFKVADAKNKTLFPAVSQFSFLNAAKAKTLLDRNKHFLVCIREKTPNVRITSDFVENNRTFTIQESGHIAKKRIFAKVFHIILRVRQ